jgi:RNA polymerase sigma-70 factor, ECF subfamily
MKELEQRWLDRFQKGDPEAFAVVYETYGDCVYRMCHRLCGCRTEAEDLTQETFVAAYRSRGRFEGRSKFGTWLCRLALDCCRAVYRKRRLRTTSVMDDSLGADDRLSESAAVTIALEDALMHLSDHHREVLLLVKVEGLKYTEAAEVLGVPEGTVKYWVHDGLLKLREILPGFEAGGCR